VNKGKASASRRITQMSDIWTSPRSRAARAAAELVLSRGIMGAIVHPQNALAEDAWEIGTGLGGLARTHSGHLVNKGKEKGRDPAGPRPFA
jgi:hypothetical protein